MDASTGSTLRRLLLLLVAVGVAATAVEIGKYVNEKEVARLERYVTLN